MTKKNLYFSFNSSEFAILNELASHAEIALYFVLKKHSSFTNATVGNFGVGVTYESLAKAISRPSTQGKPAVEFDRKQVQRLLESLQQKKLVSNIKTEPKLTLKLPLSLLHLKSGQAATNAANSADDVEGKLPQDNHADPLETLEVLDDCPFDEESSILTVSTPTDNPQHTNQILSSSTKTNLQGVRTPSGPTRAIHPALKSVEGGVMRKTQTEGGRAIEEVLEKTGRFEWTDGVKSRENYERWAALPGFSLGKLYEAIAYLDDDCPLGKHSPIGLSKVVHAACSNTKKLTQTNQPRSHPNTATGKLIL